MVQKLSNSCVIFGLIVSFCFVSIYFFFFKCIALFVEVYRFGYCVNFIIIWVYFIYLELFFN